MNTFFKEGGGWGGGLLIYVAFIVSPPIGDLFHKTFTRYHSLDGIFKFQNTKNTFSKTNWTVTTKFSSNLVFLCKSTADKNLFVWFFTAGAVHA